jgi:hypothetical protein
MLVIFQRLKIDREAMMAIQIFCEAAKREAATIELTQRVARFLRRAQGDPDLRFEETTGAGRRFRPPWSFYPRGSIVPPASVFDCGGSSPLRDKPSRNSMRTRSTRMTRFLSGGRQTAAGMAAGLTSPGHLAGTVKKSAGL